MSAAVSATFTAPAGATQTAFRSAAVVRGIGLIGVVKGFARSVLGLGQVMSDAIARLKREGADPDSANAGYDFKGVFYLLQRAVLMADALKARLRTPAVALALTMARFGVGRASARNERPQPAEQPELDEFQSWIAYLRADDTRRRGWREAIEGLSDREVLTRIHADLLEASSMLGETGLAAEVRALGCKAVALLDAPGDATPGDATPADATPGDTTLGDTTSGDVPTRDLTPDDRAPNTAVTPPALDGKPDEGPDPNRTPGAWPPVREVGRGPP